MKNIIVKTLNVDCLNYFLVLNYKYKYNLLYRCIKNIMKIQILIKKQCSLKIYNTKNNKNITKLIFKLIW